jgi:hypothetical protein
LDIIFVSGSVQSLHGVVGRQSPANKVGHGEGEGVDEKGQKEEEDDTEDSVGFGDLCCLFELVERGILGQLEVDVIDKEDQGTRRTATNALPYLTGQCSSSLCPGSVERRDVSSWRTSVKNRPKSAGKMLKIRTRPHGKRGRRRAE